MLGVCSLFIPASSPRMINTGLSLRPSSLIFDLEDAVSPDEKDAARELLRYALPLFADKTVAIRINAMDGCWREDLELAKDPAVKVVVVPKAEEGSLAAVDAGLEVMGCQAGIAALIESAVSLESLDRIVRVSSRLTDLLLGAEDYCLDMGIERTVSGEEIFFARAQLCNAAHAHGLEALDTPFPGTQDDSALDNDTRLAKRLGFTGKLAINPHQIATIQRVFMPTEAALDWARQVVAATSDPANKGKGAIALHGKMIDRPVLKRAERTLALGQSLGEWES
jgi:citrate lyase subunit beta/citryl-CoA lyase